jgi:uncharacterized protein (DUF362 family)
MVIAPNTSQVSLQRVSTYELAALRQALQALLAPWGGIAAFWPDAVESPRVLLKPNLLTGSHPERECTTRPELVQVVAEAVLAAGGRPFIGDSPAFGSARGVAKSNGLLPICETLGIPIVEFHGETLPLHHRTLAHLHLSREALQADVIINLPKVKSHMQLGVTLGVKNLFGCVPGKLKAWWHMEAGKDPLRFGKMLVETALALHPQLTIADGIIGHEGNGPSGGSPRPLHLLAAAPDVFALERVLMAVLQVDPIRVPVFQAAQELNVLPDLSELQILGPDWQSFCLGDWKLADQTMPIDFGLPRVMRSTVKHLLTLLGESWATP